MRFWSFGSCNQKKYYTHAGVRSDQREHQLHQARYCVKYAPFIILLLVSRLNSQPVSRQFPFDRWSSINSHAAYNVPTARHAAVLTNTRLKKSRRPDYKRVCGGEVSVERHVGRNCLDPGQDDDRYQRWRIDQRSSLASHLMWSRWPLAMARLLASRGRRWRAIVLSIV